MTWKLSQRSLRNLAGVHPDLVKVVHRALERSPVDFCVVEGLRTEARQRQLLAAGASQTLKSRHLTGHAVDLFIAHRHQGGRYWSNAALSVFAGVVLSLPYVPAYIHLIGFSPAGTAPAA